MQSLLRKSKNSLNPVSAYFRCIVEQVHATSAVSSPSGSGAVGYAVNVRISRHPVARRPIFYGVEKYSTSRDASEAKEMPDSTPLDEKSLWEFANTPSFRNRRAGKVFISNIDERIDLKTLEETFSPVGKLLSCKLKNNFNGKSLGQASVEFENEESAKKAVEKLNGMLLKDRELYVAPFLNKRQRVAATKTYFKNLVVSNLSKSTTEDDLKAAFEEYGSVTRVAVMRDSFGNSYCYGFVNFSYHDDAAKAVEGLNGKRFEGTVWSVERAKKPSEREWELKEAADNWRRSNLFIKNLDKSISEEKVKELFSSFGKIRSCKVMLGSSRGSGFVAFFSPEEAAKALREMNGKMVEGKALYVAMAESEEEKRDRLRAKFSGLASSKPPAATADDGGGGSSGGDLLEEQRRLESSECLKA